MKNSTNHRRVDVEITIPCKNEAIILERNTEKLLGYLKSKSGKYTFRIIIAVNGSTDDTYSIAKKLAKKYKNIVEARRIEKAGRGRALRDTWGKSEAKIVAYMDADLATSLDNFKQLIDPLQNKKADMTVGSRLLPGSRAKRTLVRRIVGGSYAWLVRLFLGLEIRDYQCGFKAMRSKVASELVYDVGDNNWFFDTELISKVVDSGYKVIEVPVKWRESERSSVRLFASSYAMLTALNRLSTLKKRVITPERLLITGLLLLTGLIYFVGITSRGWANPYYSMAIQAGASSWKAFFFGSIDSLNFVTLDKLPMIVWPSALSVRLFGTSSLAVFWPYALAGVLSTFVLYKIIRKDFGVASGFIAGLVFALTPISVVIFRFNNPDAFLVLFLLLVTYYFIEILREQTWKNYLLCALFLGLAFQAKSFQALVLAPVLMAVYGFVLWYRRQTPRYGMVFAGAGVFLH